MEICQRRKITTLVHFTRLRNLPSILMRGLLPRLDLETLRGDDIVFNDMQRFDGLKNASCLSITFPNYKMFYKQRQYHLEPWVVLGIDARVLWEFECAYCTANASSNALRFIPLSVRQQPDALERMFDDFHKNGHVVHRSMLPIDDNHTTNPQAEVLAFGRIPQEYFHAIYFEDEYLMRQLQSHHETRAQHIRISVCSDYFKPRRDYAFWQD
ncbi:MAG: DUF4433 domain-containing protein [Chloroflexota bacterium]|nr:DUF4433 domain-containing protein [Chloroflexota bacterium]